MQTLLKGIVLSILLSQQIFAATPPIFSTEEGAIEGYDPVAYFTEAEPVKGLDSFQFKWQGAIFKFSSVDNLALFKDNPEKYAPQYGGYCAYAMSEGATANTVPEAWSIVDGKLYLNFSRGVRALWSKDIPGRIAKADANWPDIVN